MTLAIGAATRELTNKAGDLANAAAPNRVATKPLDQANDKVETRTPAEQLADRPLVTHDQTTPNNAAQANTQVAGLIDTAHHELVGAKNLLGGEAQQATKAADGQATAKATKKPDERAFDERLATMVNTSDSLQGESLTSKSLTPVKTPLKVNSDGSITTPGGFTVINSGGTNWSVKSPSGKTMNVSGDPHVDEDGDGVEDFEFNTDASFILPDGTKIFCDTDKYGGTDATVSHTLKIQSGDSLGTMDVLNGGPGTVTTGGLQYDKQNSDAALFVMGQDGKFYDGNTGGKLVKSGGASVGVDNSRISEFSKDATDTLNLSRTGVKHTLGRVSDTTQLKTLGSAFLVDDTDGAATEAQRREDRIAQDKILGIASDADTGMGALEPFDKNGDGVLTGAELDGIKVWVDKNEDGKIEAGELKLLADFNIDKLNVKMDVQHQPDGTTRLQSQLTRDGNTVHTNDRIDPLNDHAHVSNFQRQLVAAVGDDPFQRALARDRVDAVSRQLQQELNQQTVQGQGGRLAAHAGQQLLGAQGRV